MDEETLQKIGFAAGGIVAGALGYHLLSGGREPLYTGLTRAYKGPADAIVAGILAIPEEGYIVRFEKKKNGTVFNPFPDFKSPIFPMPFSAALYADYIAAGLEYEPSGIWAEVTNEAAEKYQKERREE